MQEEQKLVEKSEKNHKKSKKSEISDTEENEEKKIWKRNIPLYYKYLVSHILEWPSLTCQYMPIFIENEEKEFINQKIIIGTNTGDKSSNYLYIANIRLPNPRSKNYNPTNFKICKKEDSYLKTGINTIELETRILHPGEIYKARVMYNSYNMISTKAKDGKIYIFDYSNHPFEPDNNVIKPKMVLEGLEKEGWGLDWKIDEPKVVSSDDNGFVCEWDIEKSKVIEQLIKKNEGSYLKYVNKFRFGENSVNEVKYHRFFQDLFGLVSNKDLAIYDTRKDFKKAAIQTQGSEKEIFSIDFSYDHEFLFITGGEGGILNLWDLRKNDKSLSLLQNSGESILRSEWSPTTEGIFMTSGEDKKISFWDCKKIEEGNESNAKFFLHQGFSGVVNDICWNPCLPFSVAAVDDNNEVQIFQIDDDFYYN